jgi:hypothetical protein
MGVGFTHYAMTNVMVITTHCRITTYRTHALYQTAVQIVYRTMCSDGLVAAA